MKLFFIECGQNVGKKSLLAIMKNYLHADITERLNAMETLESSLNLSQIEWKK
ncbi:hypothetical protein [Bifidobacterium aquikefiri]|uniref:hypothetical protein n=1 Tax=Bifidobacterium aquikefiri TaxID=1653207 RepID=UPI0023F39DB7|nr:hypothetical protein [Bifidobacterium aquikefiri]